MNSIKKNLIYACYLGQTNDCNERLVIVPFTSCRGIVYNRNEDNFTKNTNIANEFLSLYFYNFTATLGMSHHKIPFFIENHTKYINHRYPKLSTHKKALIKAV